MNLENLNVVQLSTEENQKIEGGWYAIAIAIYLAVAIYAHNNYHP